MCAPEMAPSTLRPKADSSRAEPAFGGLGWFMVEGLGFKVWVLPSDPSNENYKTPSSTFGLVKQILDLPRVVGHVSLRIIVYLVIYDSG